MIQFHKKTNKYWPTLASILYQWTCIRNAMLHAMHYFWWKKLMFHDRNHTVCAHDRWKRKWILLHTVFMVRSVPGGVPSVRGQGNETQPADALKEMYAAALWCAVLECLFKWRAFECCSPADCVAQSRHHGHRCINLPVYRQPTMTLCNHQSVNKGAQLYPRTRWLPNMRCWP